MEMKKIACAVLVAAASLSAVMATDAPAAAPGPSSDAAAAALPVVGLYSMKFRAAATLILFLVMFCSKITAYRMEENDIAPSPSMVAGSGVASLVSVVALGFSVMFYVVDVLMH
ncbi:hypothetical protein F0562_014512 [Nyssa sinensis]|uniref:CASP-like protein n=1 Tax=Nyssa sinensis TaxID=561372 RepID=A0A5J4ZR98_9ASTE|nr:hypothetical protein F0562_014512 [Nyssa sinensis]